MKQGFTLIELVIAVTISSMLAMVLFVSYSQITRSSRKIDDIISIDTRASVLQNQFNLDISGVFVPNVTPIKEEKKKPEAKEGEAAKEPEAKEEEKKELERVFFSVNEKENLRELTFITCNPLQVYGEAKPRIARVIYSVKEDKERPGSLSLFRQESLNIEYKNAKEAFAYEVVSGIKNISIEFMTPKIKEQKNKEKQEERPQEKPEFEITKQWEERKEKKGDIVPKIPQYVNLKITFWLNEEQITENSFEFRNEVYAFNAHVIPKVKQTPKITAPNGEQPAQQPTPVTRLTQRGPTPSPATPRQDITNLPQVRR